MRFLRFPLVLVFLAAAAPASAQSAILVNVVDEATGAPLSGMTVILHGSALARSQEAATDSTGVALFQGLAAGVYGVLVRGVGYVAAEASRVEVNGSNARRLRFELKPEPVRLPQVEGIANRAPALARAGFYQRKETTNGVFIDEAEIDERNQRRTTDLLRGTPGLQVIPGPNGEQTVFMRSSIGGSGPCPPRVILDGNEVVVQSGGGGVYLDRLILPHNLAGIEVYRSHAQVPAQFSGQFSSCGAILLWTRTGR